MFNALTSVDSTTGLLRYGGREGAALLQQVAVAALALHCRRRRREKPQRAEGETSEGRGERGNLRSDYSGEEEQSREEGIRRGGRKERANMLVAGNPATPTNGEVRADDHNRVFTSRHPTTVNCGKVEGPLCSD